MTIEVPANLLCDKKSVVKNSSIPPSFLNKRHKAIYYHRVRGDHTVGFLLVVWIPGELKLTDLFTKTKMPGNTSYNLVESIVSNTASPIIGTDS